MAERGKKPKVYYEQAGRRVSMPKSQRLCRRSDRVRGGESPKKK